MSRVARWIENGSVAYFPTPIDRQNVMGPGAEYLILFFQVITESDMFANLVQFFSYVFIILGLAHIVRIIRIPSRWAPYIVILTVTAPMAIMQASSTKNDLVASLMTIAILISSKRIFLGDIRKIKFKEYFLIGICFSAGYLVKPTSIIVCFPLLFGSAILQVFLLKTRLDWQKVIAGVCAFALVISLVAGPDIIRKISNNVSRHEVYSLFSQYDSDRLWNPVRGLAQNIPFPKETQKVLGMLGYNGVLRTNNVVTFQEDMVGNPFQVLFLLFCLSLSLILVPLVYTRQLFKPLLFAMSPGVAWYVFGLIVKDQAWLTRLQLPLIVLLPFSFVLIGRFNIFKSKIFSTFIGVCAMSSLAYAALTAAHVPPRPLTLAHFWGERANREGAYYNNVGLQKEHDFLLDQAVENQCSRIGLILGDNSIEYPLTWRGRQKGLATRHLWESSQVAGESDRRMFTFLEETKDWPCILYVASGSREAVPMQGKQWLSVNGNYHTFVRSLDWEYQHSKTICFKSEQQELINDVEPVNGMKVSVNDNGILITANNDDPYFYISDVICTKGQSAIMKIDIKSDVETYIKIYYQTPSESKFTEKNSLKAGLIKGDNSVYFFLPSDIIIGKFRIDPGAKKGIYELLSVNVRRVENHNDATEPDRTFHIKMQ